MKKQLAIEVKLKMDLAEFSPRDEVSGVVTITGAGEKWIASYADVILYWETSGKGNRDEGVAGVVNLAKHRQAMPAYHERPFSLRLPDMPWTYYGHNIKIRWHIGVWARGKSSKGERLEGEWKLPIVVHPNPESIRFAPGSPLPEII